MATPEPADPPGKPRQPRLLQLVVDPDEHADEIARFLAKIVTPPPGLYGTPNRMCSLWIGAIADDGYGRFAIVRDGHPYTVKAHRYAAAYKLDVPVAFGEVIEHVTCDNPICATADPSPDPRIGHIWPSTQAQNLQRMAHKGRGGGSGWMYRRWSRLNRAERAERSRQLRDAVKDGWDAVRVREILLRIDPAQTALF
jgi:hypothetical protein